MVGREGGVEETRLPPADPPPKACARARGERRAPPPAEENKGEVMSLPNVTPYPAADTTRGQWTTVPVNDSTKFSVSYGCQVSARLKNCIYQCVTVLLH